MSAAKKGLGRGFESLIPTDLLDDTFDATAQQDKSVSQLVSIPLASIHANAGQPRKIFDHAALQELADSIKEHGVLQPIVVVKDGEGYQIVAGERRFRASKMAELKEVPVIIRTMTDQNQLEVALIENIQRRDLNVVETATAYAKLRDQFNLTFEQIGKRVHKSTPAVMNAVRLLKLPREVLLMIAEGIVSEGQVRPLVGFDEKFVKQMAARIAKEGWSSRKVEQFMVSYKKQSTAEKKTPAVPKAHARYEAHVESLKKRFNTPVDLRVNSKGAGKLTISFKDEDDFKRIRDLLDK